MAKTTITSFAGTTSPATFADTRPGRRGMSVMNLSTNTVYVSVGSTTVGSTSHTAAIPQNGLYETPAFYNGEGMVGFSTAAGSTSFGANVTEWL